MKLELIIAYFLSVNIFVLGMGPNHDIEYLGYEMYTETEFLTGMPLLDYRKISLKELKEQYNKKHLESSSRKYNIKYACDSSLLEEGDIESIKFLLEQGVDPNLSNIELIGKKCWFSQYKIARLLLLYGLRLSPADDRETQATYEKHIYPALTEPMKAAALGDRASFDEIVQNNVQSSKPADRWRGLFNAALRYAAANCHVGMVKDLLERGANPLAECPYVVDDVATTEDLIIRLRDREDHNTNIRNSYDTILELFKNSNWFARKKALGMYWQLRVLADNGLCDIIPLMILHLYPEIAQQELEIAKQQIEDIESEFDRIHYNRAAAKKLIEI